MDANILFFSETQTLPAYKIENKMQQGIKTSFKEEYKTRNTSISNNIIGTKVITNQNMSEAWLFITFWL